MKVLNRLRLKFKAKLLRLNWAIQDKLLSNVLQKSGAFAGVVTFFFALWQMDVICIPRIWNDPPMYGALAASQNLTPYDMGFAALFGKAILLNTGQGYNICQALMVIGLALVFLSLWYWD